jgi:DNA-binding PucR family transcriptional regulator
MATPGSPIARRLLSGLPAPPEPVETACAPEEIAEASAVLGKRTVGWAVSLSHHAFEAVRREIQAEHPREFYTRLARAIERSALDLLCLLAGRSAEFALNPDQLAVVSSVARDGLPFEHTVHGLRLVQRLWTETLLDLAEQHRPGRERIPLLREVTGVLTTFFNQTVDAVIAEYLAERQRLLAQRLGNQRQLVAAILAGQYVEPASARATLGVELAQHHLAFLLWLDDPYNQDGYLEQAALRVAKALGCPAPFITGLEGAAWAWASRPRPFTETDYGAVRALEPAGVRIALGQPGRGAAGFRRSHIAAQDAYRIAKRSPAARVVVYHDIALVALLAGDLEQTRWFVAEQLGPLDRDEPAIAELRRTLLTYFDEGGSLVKSAAALHVHRNTVVYRLRRIERLLGRRVTDRVLETHAALRLATLGPEAP